MTSLKSMMSPSSGKAAEEVTTDVTPEDMTSLAPMMSPSNILYLNCVSVSVMMVLLWILCCYLNRVILHKAQEFYASRSPHFRQLIEFVATIDIVFGTIFMLYYFASLAPNLLHSNKGSSAQNRICYELNKGIGEWVFNVAFTAGLVVIFRQSLLALLYKQEKCSQSHHGQLKTLASHLFTVNTWRNSWALALLILLLAGPWMATSAVLEHMPDEGPAKEICLYSAPVWTILLPITICITVVSVLLVSGWSTRVAETLKWLTSFSCCCENNNDHNPSNRNGFHSCNEVSYHDNKETYTEKRYFPEIMSKKEESSIMAQLLLGFIILLGVVMFVVLILYGNLYSDTSQVLRSQLAISMTSLFQMIVFYYGKDSPSISRALSVTSGDVVTL